MILPEFNKTCKPQTDPVLLNYAPWSQSPELQRTHALALTKDLADAGVMHVWEGLENFPPLILGPHHEGIHGSLDVAAVPGLREMAGAWRIGR